ncbi:hypothetical protein KFZ58_00220 [Virgibacillus sp. NKC19-16]|uniref:hypothetical protein n=1 Tax=Virgibacillus salidurans TaxID=2831673 RepID=UPI001F48B1DE|nr:hypothetical protein [Virgibacillus sp. NKC19-16]UJL46448.1 hypothetical protein KFZ58_00220 [Virgibacillus sp. NKC19-16]
MKKVNINDLNQWINKRKPEVERSIIRNRDSERLIRTRERDKDEQKIIDKLCIERWKKAEQEGKIKYLSKRKWFYDFD